MKLESSAFSEGGSIPSQYTCDGGDTYPPLTISDVPEGTMSLALIMEDPDVPAEVREDKSWTHWVVWNMPPDTATLAEGSMPPGIEGANTGGNKGYMGPCPPTQYEPNEHRYYSTLYALDTMLDLPEGASKEELLTAMEGHIIESVVLMGRYSRA
jgi:Raf kinase inhibitor-like YbhB/YbcL family protein